VKALTIRQPWAWLIVNGHKDIENRTWPSYRRGPILIHASKGMTRAEYEEVADMLAWQPGIYEQKIELPAFEALERGGIVGMATIAGCVTKSDSPWFFGPHGFLLRDVQKLPFIEFKGALGFFDVPDGVLP
jgi:hypothetical protein